MTEPTTIAARRHRALMIVRIVVVALAVFGGIPLIYNVALALVSREPSFLWTMWGDTNWLSWGVALLAPAFVLFLFDRRIVRWMIPVPRRECHECGYPLRGLSPATTRCPECGTAVAGPTPAGAAALRK